MARSSARRGVAAARPDGYARRMASGLRRSVEAVEALRSVGLDDAAVAELGLGLRESYVRADGTVVTSVLAYPLAARSGRTRFGCVNLPGVTINPEHPVAWSPGDPDTVRRGAGDQAVLVSAAPLDAWRLGLAAARLGLPISAIASSQPDRLPAEWASRSFWAGWKRILILPDVPAVVREAVATAARRPIEVAKLPTPSPSGPDTPARDDDWLGDLLDGVGRVQGVEAICEAGVDDAVGDFPAEPIALHGGWSGGHLFYPFGVERRSRCGGGRMLHSYETLVLRSDGAILEPQVLPAPPGTPQHRRVHALADGTRIVSAPQVSTTASWSLAGIRAFAAARRDGSDPCTRPPREVIVAVHDAVAARCHFGRPGDAWVAAGFVAMSHLYRVFSALPLLLVAGEKGSGKSELAGTLASLGFNATVMGQGSAAALIRMASESGGMVVLDDAEGLAREDGFSELGQCLKLGYKAATARKPVALPSGRVETFDFFSPRVITTTRGVDPILASRCIEITTVLGNAARAGTGIDDDCGRLRDELHAMAMSRATDVVAAYGPLMAAVTGRAGEIRAPLLAIAAAFRLPELGSALA